MSDIVIGAQNQASKILEDVGRSTHVLSKDIEGLANTSKMNFSAMLGPLAAVGVAFAAFKGASAALSSVTGFLSDSIDAYGEAEDAARKLAIAIDLSGASSGQSMEKHQELAAVMQTKLGIEDEVTMGLMAQASMMGVQEDKLDSVTKAAVGLAETMGTSLDDGLKKVRLALDGNFKGIEKLVPSIKEMATNEEKLAAVMALSEKGLIQKEEAAGAMSQADERAGLAFGEFMESVGAAILPLQALVYDGLEIVITTLNAAFGPSIASAGDFFKSFSETVVTGAQWLAESIIASVTFIEIVWNNLGKVYETVGAVVLLALETMRADIEHILTSVIPAYATWFADNFVNIFRDAGMAIVTVFSNLGTIIGEIFAGIWGVITGQESISEAMANVGRAAGRGLLDGFEASTQALPEIAARAMTDSESALSSLIASNTDSIMDEFQTKFGERMEQVQKDIEDKPLEAAVNLTMNDGVLDKAGKKKKDKTDSTDTALSASESRLLTRGRIEDPSITVAQNTQAMKEQNEEMKELLAEQSRSLSKIAENTDAEEEAVD